MLGAILAGDDASRDVYADWLEQRGDTARADLLRVQERLHAMPLIAPAFDAALRQLRTLERRVDAVWRQRIARPLQIPFWLEFPNELWRGTGPTPAVASTPETSEVEAWLLAKRLRPRPATVRELASAPTSEPPPTVLDPRPTPFRWLSTITGAIVLLVMVLYWLGLVG